jgi:PBP1b-binding outer membrane lipoprotein LpoB
MMIPGIENRTSQYMDTKALTDRMRTEVFRSGKAQFINEARREDLLKEQGYQAVNATPETQALIGRQLGAKYMITGSMIEMSQRTPRQVRVSKTKEIYYKLTVEITDLETGLLAWTTEREFARAATEPLIGW